MTVIDGRTDRQTDRQTVVYYTCTVFRNSVLP